MVIVEIFQIVHYKLYVNHVNIINDNDILCSFIGLVYWNCAMLVPIIHSSAFGMSQKVRKWEEYYLEQGH